MKTYESEPALAASRTNDVLPITRQFSETQCLDVAEEALVRQRVLFLGLDADEALQADRAVGCLLLLDLGSSWPRQVLDKLWSGSGPLTVSTDADEPCSRSLPEDVLVQILVDHQPSVSFLDRRYLRHEVVKGRWRWPCCVG